MDYALLSKVVEAKTDKAIIYFIRFKILPRRDFRVFTFAIKNSFISKILALNTLCNEYAHSSYTIGPGNVMAENVSPIAFRKTKHCCVRIQQNLLPVSLPV